MDSRPARESSSSLLILGNLTPQQAKKLRNCLADILGDDHIQHVHFPSQQHHDGQAGDRNCQSFLPEIDPSMPAVLEVNSSMDSFCKNLYYRGKLEFKLTKAIGAIGQYQKQHQELMDNFVCLSNKYQQLKSNFNAATWEYLPRLKEFSAVPVLDKELEEGETQVGNYSLGKLIGTGHFATVCEITSVNHRKHKNNNNDDSHHNDEQERLALKAIDKTHVKNVSGLERIAKEIEALKVLQHPNILQLYDVLHGTKCIYLVCQRLSTDLYDVIGEHPNGLDPLLAKRIIYPILEGITFIHSQGYVHRDLKPENILVDRRKPAFAATRTNVNSKFTIKICDFGLCSRLPSHSDGVFTDFCGSPGFICPEMIVEKRYNGQKADFFSVGCILLELLLPAKDFGAIWMKTFQHETSSSDPLSFQHQLRVACTKVQEILRAKSLACASKPEDTDLFKLASGLLQMDPSKRFSTAEVQRYLASSSSSGDRCSGSTSVEKGEEQQGQQEQGKGAEAKIVPIITSALDKITLSPDSDDNAAVAAFNNRQQINYNNNKNNNNRSQRRSLTGKQPQHKPVSRRSPPLLQQQQQQEVLMRAAKSKSPCPPQQLGPPSPSRGLALASDRAKSPSPLPGNSTRPTELIISSPRSAFSSSSSPLSFSSSTCGNIATTSNSSMHNHSVRSSLRAQTLLKLEEQQQHNPGGEGRGDGIVSPCLSYRERDYHLRPDSPCTPLAASAGGGVMKPPPEFFMVEDEDVLPSSSSWPMPKDSKGAADVALGVAGSMSMSVPPPPSFVTVSGAGEVVKGKSSDSSA